MVTVQVGPDETAEVAEEQSPMRQKRSPQHRMSNRKRLHLRLSQRRWFWRIFRGLEVGDGELLSTGVFTKLPVE